METWLPVLALKLWHLSWGRPSQSEWTDTDWISSESVMMLHLKIVNLQELFIVCTWYVWECIIHRMKGGSRLVNSRIHLFFEMEILVVFKSLSWVKYYLMRIWLLGIMTKGWWAAKHGFGMGWAYELKGVYHVSWFGMNCWWGPISAYNGPYLYNWIWFIKNCKSLFGLIRNVCLFGRHNKNVVSTWGWLRRLIFNMWESF